MIYLAKQPREELTLISEIAKAQKVSASFLAKIFQGLSKAGLVDSVRGVAGGVNLARDPKEISLRNIVEAVEGPVALNRCLRKKDPCENTRTCPLADVWREAQEKMLEVLETATLASVNGK
jgi:Rrf2 family protein